MPSGANILNETDKPTLRDRVCPLRELAYTIAGVPITVAEPVCIGERCAWYVKDSECCAVKLSAMP